MAHRADSLQQSTPENKRYTLDDLADTEEWPGYPTWFMMAAAIRSSPSGALTAEEIRNRMARKFPALQSRDSWRATVRHDLSRKLMFELTPRPLLAPGRGGWWRIVEGVPPNSVRPSRDLDNRGKHASTSSRRSTPRTSRPRKSAPNKPTSNTAPTTPSRNTQRTTPRNPPTNSQSNAPSAAHGGSSAPASQYSSEVDEDQSSAFQYAESAENQASGPWGLRGLPPPVNYATRPDRLTREDNSILLRSRVRGRALQDDDDDDRDEQVSKRQRVASPGRRPEQRIGSTSRTPSMHSTCMRATVDTTRSAFGRWEHGSHSLYDAANDWEARRSPHVPELEGSYISSVSSPPRWCDSAFREDIEDSPPQRRNEFVLFPPDPFAPRYATSSERDRPLSHQEIHRAEEPEARSYRGSNMLGLHHVSSNWDEY
ncbi:hypothetical protein AURDEDRAFT_126429 [Auricularia subglabra TFB-10046 SS5]|nr:hypothetical protein AURDEDRAFT_126429 [Auricularia subglabra TFB-10046 SS5]